MAYSPARLLLALIVAASLFCSSTPLATPFLSPSTRSHAISRGAALWSSAGDAAAPSAVSASAAAPVAAAVRTKKKEPKKEPKRFVEVTRTTKGNGGYFVETKVTSFDKVTAHGLVVSSDWVKDIAVLSGTRSGKEGREEEEEVYARDVAKACLLFLMDKGQKMENTEGMIDASVFPVNYFSARTIGYFYENANEGIALQLKKLRTNQLEGPQDEGTLSP